MADLWKIVDTFNGWEGPTFVSRRDAEDALRKDMSEFYDNLANQDAQYKKDIVPANHDWYWDQRQNQYIWG